MSYVTISMQMLIIQSQILKSFMPDVLSPKRLKLYFVEVFKWRLKSSWFGVLLNSASFVAAIYCRFWTQMTLLSLNLTERKLLTFHLVLLRSKFLLTSICQILWFQNHIPNLHYTRGITP